MAEPQLFRVSVLDGPWAGEYTLEPKAFTATEAGLFRKALGASITALLGDKDLADIDGIAGLIWLTLRRRSEHKALPYPAVADTLTYANVDVDQDDKAKANVDGEGDVAQEEDALDPEA